MDAKPHREMPSSIKKELDIYPELLRLLLFHRGITTQEQAQVYLAPLYDEHLHDPFLLQDMHKAVEKILSAIQHNEHIAVYADYDADGIPGAVIVNDFFKKIGFTNFEVYLPHRHEEGYGFHKEAVDTLVKNETALIITIDVGITDIETVEYAKEQGVEVIITDHHEPAELLPDAFAVVNPKLGEYPEPMLCGAAVAWKLVCALIETLKNTNSSVQAPVADVIGDGWEKWLLDMVGIATISDMVPLTGENRVLAYYGLKVLRKSRRPGLQLLLEQSGVSQQHLTEDDIAFMIAPRLNAASRMSHPDEAFKVLSARSKEQARDAVAHIIDMNNERKTLVASVMRKVKSTLKRRSLGEVVVIGDPEWQLGVLGLVATKITEEFEKPAFVWSRENGVIKGSCRASNGVSVLDVMSQAKHQFIQFGGHGGAGGFSLELEQVHLLEETLSEAYRQVKTDDAEKKEALTYDSLLELGDVTMGTYALIEQCAPFGIANEKPVFLFQNVIIEKVRTFGKTSNHMELHLKDMQGSEVTAIQFFKTPEEHKAELSVGKSITLLAQFDYSMFRNRPTLRLRILDIS